VVASHLNVKILIKLHVEITLSVLEYRDFYQVNARIDVINAYLAINTFKENQFVNLKNLPTNARKSS
jgi:hypothetical protein